MIDINGGGAGLLAESAHCGGLQLEYWRPRGSSAVEERL